MIWGGRRLQRRTVNQLLLNPCVYCGEVANTKDHFVPRAFRSSVEEWRKLGFECNGLLWACTECNSTAGAKVFATIAEKREYVKDRYRAKYRKLIDSPAWSEDEIEELGESLKTTILQHQHRQIRLMLRLSWPYEDEVEALTASEYRKLLENAA